MPAFQKWRPESVSRRACSGWGFSVKPETRRLYAVMDSRLAANEFFAGTEISIADFAIVGWAWRHPRHKVDLADYPNVQRWYQAMMARPGVARGFAVALRRG
jgi:GST-like protein